MIRHYIKISLRNLLKNKLFSAIKLLGLTTGVTSCVLIGLYLQHELHFDAFHEKADRIVRVTMSFRFDGNTRNVGVTGNKVVPAFRQDFPEVENGVRINAFTEVVKNGDQMFEEKDFYYADSTFFEIFTFPFLSGDARTALNAPNQVVLTKRMAAKYFGDENPIGKLLKVGTSQSFTVTGVMADPPANSQLQPGFVASIVGLPDMRPDRATWWNANYGAYLLLRDGDAWKTLQAKIPAYMRRFASEHNAEGDNFLTYNLEPLRSVHLHSTVANKFEPNGDIRYLYMLALVSLFILIIGATTYVNLTTAVSTERAKEVGIQKVLGAGKIQFIWQHLGEAGILTGLALLCGYALAIPLLPAFSTLIDRPLHWAPLTQPGSILAALGFWALVSVLAGAYPAFAVSGFLPARVLKGQFKFSSSGAWLRKSLIVLQFGISFFLIVCTMVLKQQLGFIQNKKLGFDKEQVLVLEADQNIIDRIDAIKSEWLEHSGINAVSLAYESPVLIKGGYGIDKSVAGRATGNVQALPVDQDFIKTMNIEMAAGDDLDRQDVELARRQQKRLDTVSMFPILINEKQAKLFNWTPEEAVNKLVNFNGRESRIKGVVKDFHFTSMHEPIGNLVLFPDTWGQVLLLKLGGNNVQSTLGFLENSYKTLVPHRPFAWHFLDEELEKLYRSEIRTSRLISTFSALAIFLACLGLFGLASHSIAQRTKEIGIRKVLGASLASVLTLLSRDFLKIVLLAVVLATPLAWYVMQNWLENFAYRIELRWWVFAVAGATAVAVAFLTVSYQSLKAALDNPVKSLRSE